MSQKRKTKNLASDISRICQNAPNEVSVLNFSMQGVIANVITHT